MLTLTSVWNKLCKLRKDFDGQKPLVLATSFVPIYEYRDLWAEESGAATANSAEWSFGNGATGFIGLPVDEGWELVDMYYHADTYAARTAISVDLMNYGNTPSNAAANTLATISLASATDGGGTTNNAYKYEKLATPIPIPANAVLGFITRTLRGSASDHRVGVRLRRKVGDAVSNVALV